MNYMGWVELHDNAIFLFEFGTGDTHLFERSRAGLPRRCVGRRGGSSRSSSWRRLSLSIRRRRSTRTRWTTTGRPNGCRAVMSRRWSLLMLMLMRILRRLLLRRTPIGERVPSSVQRSLLALSHGSRSRSRSWRAWRRLCNRSWSAPWRASCITSTRRWRRTTRTLATCRRRILICVRILRRSARGIRSTFPGRTAHWTSDGHSSGFVYGCQCLFSRAGTWSAGYGLATGSSRSLLRHRAFPNERAIREGFVLITREHGWSRLGESLESRGCICISMLCSLPEPIA